MSAHPEDRPLPLASLAPVGQTTFGSRLGRQLTGGGENLSDVLRDALRRYVKRHAAHNTDRDA